MHLSPQKMALGIMMTLLVAEIVILLNMSLRFFQETLVMQALSILS
jgi:hypothetical protein